MSHYDTLEVSPTASPEVVRAAYRSLMQRHHPDRHAGDPAATARAAAIAAAYDVLSDPARRLAYDQSLQHPPQRAVAPAGAARRVAEEAPARRSERWWWWALPLAGVVVWGAVQKLRPAAEPADEWLALRQAFGSPGQSEARRQTLLTRKAALLRASPGLQAQALAEATREREGRTVDLLEAPLSVPAPSGTLAFARIRVVLGSFDTPKLRAYLERHRAGIVADVQKELAAVDEAQWTAGLSEGQLKVKILQALERAMGTQSQDAYPDTWFESPGRYGVIEVLFPDPPRFLPLGG